MPHPRTDPHAALDRLVGVVDALRENCGWTARLTPERLAPYLLEEAAEVSETVAAGQLGSPLASELGDVLFQILLHARLGEERGELTLTDVIEALESKLLRRNTHVFAADGSVLEEPDRDPDAAERAWQAAKTAERTARGDDPARGADPLRGLPASLSSLTLAQKALGRAEGSLTAFGGGNAGQGSGAAVPGDAPSGTRDAPQHPDAARGIGDALLALVHEARVHGVDADRALRDALVRSLS
ncbi:MazG nucleotide pyrophosphohydrolase domain-containing protein [Galactobacter valiniphilus]|uniref:MazG nucleotide pyrophosphohydrolase domain-containing protein n=1 Tax=Galactobacter valiniphilus TaxID=2676122 RepID=UPI003735DBDE